MVTVPSINFITNTSIITKEFPESWKHSMMMMIIIIIIICHDFLPPSRRGSHVKSDNTHSIIKHTPFSPYT